MATFDVIINTEVDIEEQVTSKSPTGGVSYLYTSFATSVPCHVRQLKGQAQIKYGYEGEREVIRTYFVTDPGISTADGIRYRIVHRGIAYEVLNVNNVDFEDAIWAVDAERKPK